MWDKIKEDGKKPRRASKPGSRTSGKTIKTVGKTSGKTGNSWQNVSKQDVSPTEATEQEMLFQWADFAKVIHPELGLLYHVANEGRRSEREGYRLRKQGLRRGVPDICLPVPRGHYGALYIELKRRSGGKVSEEQKAWIAALNRAGNRAVVCKGFDEAREEIERYLCLGKMW